MLTADKQVYIDLLSGFGLEYSRMRADIPLAGSPERCGWRSVVEGGDGRLWVLERLSPGQADWRGRVGRQLEALNAAGCDAVVPYRRAGDGYVLSLGGQDWQMAPYIPGDVLPRPEYIHDADRGRSLALFLGSLRRAGAGLSAPDSDAPFSLPAYIRELAETVRQMRPDVYEQIAPLLGEMDVLGDGYTDVPMALCHGDFHPLNVIWGGKGVRAVIDWEFTGLKPDLYDVANCIGCVGSEHPDYLVRGLVPAFVDGLRAEGVLRPDNERWLHPLVFALRMAWLSEWLRRRDAEMLEMEVEYMRILAKFRPQIEKGWGIGA